ncbi:MAG: hypothetical protein ABF271_16715 [Abyssibacter sp.]|uniref:hypothetical protein n=1 Tax=Abyssibacter sp. TaxID=2320200 RepID=UPI00321A3403
MTTEHQPPTGEEPGFFDHPGRIKAIVYGVYISCALLFIADVFYHKHAYTTFEGWFAFHAWYGFFGCVGLVLVAKAMRVVLMRREDYYDPPESDDAA